MIDGDVYGPNVPMMLGLKTKLEAEGQKIKPAEKYGLQVVSVGFLTEEGAPIIWRGPMLHGAVQQFFRDVAWHDVDYLIVDMPPGTGDVALSLSQTVPVVGSIVFWFLITFLDLVFGQLTSGADPFLPEWLMTNQQALSPSIWPHPFVWSNYKTVFEAFPFFIPRPGVDPGAFPAYSLLSAVWVSDFPFQSLAHKRTVHCPCICWNLFWRRSKPWMIW